MRLHGVVQLLDPEHRFHPRDQCGMLERLSQVIVAAGLKPGHNIADLGLSGDQNDRNETQLIILLQLLHDGDTIELRHHDVEQHKIGLELAHLGERILAVRGGHKLISLCGEPDPQQLQIRGIVIDNQNERGRSQPKSFHSLQEFANLRENDARAEWLRHITVAARGTRLGIVARQSIGRHRDDWYLAQLRV